MTLGVAYFSWKSEILWGWERQKKYGNPPIPLRIEDLLTMCSRPTSVGYKIFQRGWGKRVKIPGSKLGNFKGVEYFSHLGEGVEKEVDLVAKVRFFFRGVKPPGATLEVVCLGASA